MVKITEDLIRRRAEHNECVLSTLEEVSLHQQDIEKIEYIDKWCRELRILYLQSNLIPKIENVGRLKKLEYLNLALNNIERVENLEGCESLQKLDLTANFVGEVTSVECLKDLYHFRELYLTGNPCTEFDGYREFVVATLPQLQSLDGVEIEKSERIRALQTLHTLRPYIVEQQRKYLRTRATEKSEYAQQEAVESDVTQDSAEDQADRDKKFWSEKTKYTPEDRLKVHKHLEDSRKKDQKQDSKPEQRPVTLVTDDGRVLNVNEPKVDFSLTEDEVNNTMQLDVAVFKHMDTSLIDVDVQPTYVRVKLKGKVLQLVLPVEVLSDISRAERSQVTGHLLITMPKATDAPTIFRKSNTADVAAKDSSKNKQSTSALPSTPARQVLEVDPSAARMVDIGNIVSSSKTTCSVQSHRQVTAERSNSEDFVDDPNVPPLM